jgi:DNA-binding beta-propeller fold protein YncE
MHAVPMPALRLATIAAVVTMFAAAAQAQIAVSANDAKVKLVNGTVTVVPNPPRDTVTIIDLKAAQPRVIAEVEAPASVVGPPLNVAVTPDEGLALVTAAMKIDPADATKQVADNRLSVIDLNAKPPAVIATLETGASPAGLSINRAGTLALVANRAEGTVSVFAISGRSVTPRGKVTIADAKSGVSHAAFTPDGAWALVTRDGDFKISVLSIKDGNVEYTKRDIHAGLRPYGLDISPLGTIAVVANIGIGGGDADTVSVIDLKAKQPHVVNTFTVGQTPEGIKISPDGKYCAVVIMNGSNKAKENPFYADFGKLLVYRIDGSKLSKVAEGKVGHWSQGVAFSKDNRKILVQNMVEENIMVFTFDGKRLKDTGQRIKTKGGAAGIRTADQPVRPVS